MCPLVLLTPIVPFGNRPFYLYFRWLPENSIGGVRNLTMRAKSELQNISAGKYLLTGPKCW